MTRDPFVIDPTQTFTTKPEILRILMTQFMLKILKKIYDKKIRVQYVIFKPKNIQLDMRDLTYS